MSAFSALIGSLMSPDNATRTTGESMLNELKAQPDILATCLINALRHSEAVEHRSLCAVLIRRVRSGRCFFQIANARVAAFASASRACPNRHTVELSCHKELYLLPRRSLVSSRLAAVRRMDRLVVLVVLLVLVVLVVSLSFLPLRPSHSWTHDSQVLTRDDELWPKLSPPLKHNVKSELLACLHQEPERSITRKVCDSVSEIAVEIFDEVKVEVMKSTNAESENDAVVQHTVQTFLKENQGWPELLPFIFQCVQTGNPSHAESAFLVFDQLARYCMDMLIQYLGTIHGALSAGLANPSLDVKICAFSATTTFIGFLESAAEREKFQSLVPSLLGVLSEALNAGDEIAANTAVENLIEVADEHPRFLRKQIHDVAGAMIKIAEAESLDDATRRLAAEFLVTLCEARDKAPGMMRKLPQLVQQLFNCCVAFLLEIDDDPSWHTADDEKDEDAGETELYEFGQECLDRISMSIGGKSMLPVAGQAFSALMADGDWKKRHAALVGLAQIAEGCERVMKQRPVLSELVAMCVKGTSDPHAKVRWAACQGLGQLCTDLCPDLQESHHEPILGALIGLMEDFSNPRVQAHSCAAVVNFAEGCDQDIMGPYLDALITKLLALVRNGRKNVQEGALTAMASIADASGDYFIKYYDECVPLLREILEKASDRSYHMMRAKTLECISLVGMAVGKEKFGPDAAGIMQIMQNVQTAGLDPDDPFASYMLQAAARICTALGQDFVPYLPIVMPPMLQAAGAKPDFKVADADDEGAGNDEDDTETFFVAGKRVSLHTSALDEKATACSMLCCFAYELKEGFCQHVEEVKNIMIPLLKFYFNEEVRIAAAQTLPELLKSYVEGASKGMGPTEDMCRNLAIELWPQLVDSLKSEVDPNVVHVMLQSVQEMIDVAKGPMLMPVDLMGPVFDAFQVVLKDYEERRDMRMERTEGEDFDAEEEEALMEEHEAESELLDALGNSLTSILKLYGDAALQFVEALLPNFSTFLGPARYVEERRVALILMDDVIQYSPAGAAKYANQVLPQLLQGSADQDPGVRQSCVYGLGRTAEHRQGDFKPHAQNAVNIVLAIINDSDARSEENILATENAVGALGKFLEFHPECVDPAAGTLFVQNLPLMEDDEEARVVHPQLVRLVSSNDMRILGQSNANLPKIMEVLVKILGQGEKLISAEDTPAAVALVKQLNGVVPGVFERSMSGMKPKQQEAIMAAMQ